MFERLLRHWLNVNSGRQRFTQVLFRVEKGSVFISTHLDYCGEKKKVFLKGSSVLRPKENLN